MIYRRFGKTGLSMPVLSFGCMRSMHSWQDDEASEIPDAAQRNLEAILRQALAHGITHIETAYGYGSSERQLGRILAHLPRNQFLLQSKVVPTEDPEEFLTKVAQSLKRLRVDRLDLLAIHGVNDYRSLWYTCRKNGCLTAARKLQDRGIIDHIGFSGHGPEEVIRQALLHEEDGGFDFINVHWYYILTVNRSALELAVERDLGIFIISPTDKGGHLHTPCSELLRLCAPLSPILFNDLYCLRQHGVCTISIGAAAPDQFGEHLKVLLFLGQQQTPLVDEIDARLRRTMCKRTGHERPDVFWERLPTWDKAPGHINLRMVIWLFNLLRGWGMDTYARSRYNMLAEGSSWVPGNNAYNARYLDYSSLKGVEGLPPEAIKEVLLQAHQALRR